MSNFMSIVIDADIARASGTTEHPVSSGCRALLENVSKNGHCVAVCPKLMAEWKKHRSNFATKWMASMVARKRINFIHPESKAPIFIDQYLVDQSKKTVAHKDSHLIDAALHSDNVIASNDDNARLVFAELSVNFGEVRNIKWFNAISDKEFFLSYLNSNCFVPEKYYLKTVI